MDIVFIAVFSLLVVTSLVGNSLVVLVVLLNDSMKTTLNYLLVNLAVADMVFAFFTGIQFALLPLISHPDGRLGQYLCKFVTGGTASWIGGVVSIVCIVTIALDRYTAIIHPYKQKRRIIKRYLKLIICSAWIFAVLWNLPGFLKQRTYRPDLHVCKSSGEKVYQTISKIFSLGWLVMGGALPLCIMGFIYSRVVHRLWFTSFKTTRVLQKALLSRRKRITKTVITVSVIYAFCWVPDLIVYFLTYWGVLKHSGLLHKIGIALLTFNSCINPVLYSLQMKSFRQHLRDMLLCNCKCGNRNKGLRGSFSNSV